MVRPRTSHALPRAVWKLQRTLDHGKQLCLETGEEMQLAVVYTQPFTDMWSLNASKYIGFPTALSPHSAVPLPSETHAAASVLSLHSSRWKLQVWSPGSPSRLPRQPQGNARFPLRVEKVTDPTQWFLRHLRVSSNKVLLKIPTHKMDKRRKKR